MKKTKKNLVLKVFVRLLKQLPQEKGRCSLHQLFTLSFFCIFLFFAFWFVVLITETECICVTVDYSPDFGVTLHWLRRWNNFGGLIEIQ
jgi:hypothetical protein